MRYTQDNIGQGFPDRGQYVFDPQLNPASAPPIRVFQGEDGNLYSLDNRRLFVGQLQDGEVPVRYATPAEYDQMIGHLTSENGGVGITVRGGWGYFEFPATPLGGWTP